MIYITSWGQVCVLLGKGCIKVGIHVDVTCDIYHLLKHCWAIMAVASFTNIKYPATLFFFIIWGTRQRVCSVDLPSNFPRSQFNCVRCTRQTRLIHGGLTFQLTVLKGSVLNVLVPDTTAHLQGSCNCWAWSKIKFIPRFLQSWIFWWKCLKMFLQNNRER